MHRRELEGSWERDAPPALAGAVDRTELQRPEDGSGTFLRRRYRARVRGARLAPAELVARLAADPNEAAPTELARFEKVRGAELELRPNDEFVVRMPGPWDGPVRVVEVTPLSFRFATLAGHLEAGQIEWRAGADDGGRLEFTVESWSRPGDRMSSLLHHRLRMAKEVQLHMWTSVLERVAKLAGGRVFGGIDIETRTVG